ncbi:hypothetical protein PG984_015170 [Apiospora sp. TS-2023a]
MDKLCPEILSLIVDHLDADRLSRYATISRAWQHEIESRCFRNVELHVENMAAFPEIFSRRPCRRSYLRRINLALHMERMKISEPGQHYVAEQVLFRRCMFSLLATLWQWERDEYKAGLPPTRANLELCIQPTNGIWEEDPDKQWGSPLQDPRLSYLLECPETAVILKHPGYASESDPWVRFMELTFPAWMWTDDIPLPTVRRVQSLTIEGGKSDVVTVHMYLFPATSCQIAAACPSLESFRFKYRDALRDTFNYQRTVREGLVRGLQSLRGRLPSLRVLEIKRTSPDIVLNHDYYPDHMSEDDFDPVGEAIRQLAQPTVQELTLHNVFLSRDLLCNRRNSTDDDDDTWRALRRLDVKAQLVAPDGKWYTTGVDPNKPQPDGPLEGCIMPNKGDTACTPWRRYIDSTTTEPLLQDLTRVAHERMPYLREATFDLHSDDLDDYLSVWSRPSRQIDNREDWDDFEPRLRVSCRAHPEREWTVDRYLDAREWDIPRQLQSQWEEFAGKEGVVVTDVVEGDYVLVDEKCPS